MTQSSHQDWFRLDNVAKIYPVVKSYLVSNVFRITATMDGDVDPVLLKQAVLDCRNRFPSFYVKLRKGFFWYYYEPNDKEPLVVPESSYVCDPIDSYKNNWFYFVFFYYKNRISLEIFHGLTDGKGAL
ncbi:MFS transporter, partial [Candidatus Nomurabacteria bacterium]|nr:MFS transporter [Candidatus Nomurabacteria bacterium]